MAAEVNIILARARIVGGLEIDKEAPDEVQASPGDKLLLKFPFKFEEVSKEHDSFRVQITSSLGDVEAAPAIHAHDDNTGVADDHRGFIAQEYDVPPGGGTLRFRAAAEYMDGTVRKTEEVSGTVRINTEPPLL